MASIFWCGGFGCGLDDRTWLIRGLRRMDTEMPAERRGKTPFVRSAVASTFVAALELCRSAFVGLDQEEDFDTVMVYRPAGSSGS